MERERRRRGGTTPTAVPAAVPLDRRRFLVLAASATAFAALAPALAPATSWARRLPHGTSLQPWTLAPEATGAAPDVARTLIAAAVLAPSLWNTQPWRF